MIRRIVWMGVLVMAIGSQSQAQELPSGAAYRLSKVQHNVDQIAHQLKFDNLKAARDYLGWAEDGLADLLRMHRDVDPDHPDIAAVRDALAAHRAQLFPDAAPAAEPAPAPDAPDAPELDGSTRYKLDKLLASMDNARNGTLRARQSLVSDLRSSLDALLAKRSHPALSAADERLSALEQELEAAGAAHAELDRVLPALIAQLESSMQTLQSVLSALSLEISAVQGGNGEVSKMQRHKDRLLSLAPELRATLEAFRSQFPDEAALRAGHELGASALSWVGTLEEVLDDWAPREQEALEGFLRDAETSIGLAEQFLEQAQQQVAMTGPAGQSLGHAWEAAEAALALAPENEAAQAIGERVLAGQREIARLEDKAVEDEQLAIESRRFPATDFQGEEWDALREEMRQAYLEIGPDRDVRRIEVAEPWFERRMTFWDDGAWVVADYRFANGYVGAVLPSGVAYLYTICFFQEKTASGWSRPMVRVVNRAQKMLPENILE